MRYTCRSDDSLYSVLNSSAHVFPFFSQFFFSFFLFFFGWGWAKALVILPKILPSSLSRKYAFSGFEKQLHKILRGRFSQNLVQWCIIPQNRFEENLAFVTSKMRIQEFFFPLHTADAYANVPNCDALTCTGGVQIIGRNSRFMGYFVTKTKKSTEKNTRRFKVNSSSIRQYTFFLEIPSMNWGNPAFFDPSFSCTFRSHRTLLSEAVFLWA